MPYMTPPLTPASSITTAGSADSSVDAPEAEEDFFTDPDRASSRFIMVRNLSVRCNFKRLLTVAL